MHTTASGRPPAQVPQSFRAKKAVPMAQAFTAYPEINAILAEWVNGVKAILPANLVGLSLSGSLTYGDFVANRSDIDLQAVVRRPLSMAEAGAIESLHRSLDASHSSWVHRVECSYVPRHLLQYLTPPKEPRPWWGFDTMYPQAPAGNEWIINRYFLCEYGVALDGPEFRELVPPISIRDVARRVREICSPSGGRKSMMSNGSGDSHNVSYLVLNVCRILHTVLGTGPGSKRVAAQWVIDTYPQWTELVEEAEQWHLWLQYDARCRCGRIYEVCAEGD